MPGIPSGEGSGDARDRRTPFPEPYPPSVIRFFCEHKDVIGEMWSGLSHLPVDEALEALGKKLEEHSRSKAPPVHISEDEDEDEDDEDEMDEDEKDTEGGTLKSLDDAKKPLNAELYSEFERECKKPKIS